MRLVLDTNVVVSALLWGGTPYRLFQLARHQEQIELFTSSELLQEFAEVLMRAAASRRLAGINRSAYQVLASYVEIVTVVVPVTVPAVVAADPDDDHVLAAGTAAEADMIVSGDRHLLALGRYAGIPIVPPVEAVRMAST